MPKSSRLPCLITVIIFGKQYEKLKWILKERAGRILTGFSRLRIERSDELF
jgi:hypothetical protein